MKVRRMKMLEVNKIHCMDCLQGMKLIDDNSIDSIVTDPPYELNFMGKKWDSTGIAYNVELWKEALRVLKPGGHLLAFGSTRTYHRMTCAIEDAGLEIRDCIQWIYGSGFPKSMDISKAIDKAAGAEREVVGRRYAADGTPIGGRANAVCNEGWQRPWKDKPLEEQGQAWITAPATEAAKQWQGWGTALKPANEPIVVARKPIEGTVAENVLKWGTGGINIDGCRVPFEDSQNAATNPLYRKQNGYKTMCGNDNEGTSFKLKSEPMEMNINTLGRWPANVILDEEAAVELDRQSGALKSGSNNIRRQEGFFVEHGGLGQAGDIQVSYGDMGGASRFFYCAKPSQGERNFGCEDMEGRYMDEGREAGSVGGSNPRNRGAERARKNFHPTVKPLKLIEYLITLVTPKGGICLDPFEGSGTHQRACIALGFNYIGFEIDPQYFEIAEKRASNVQLKMF
jgi:DNA modification methylase